MVFYTAVHMLSSVVRMYMELGQDSDIAVQVLQSYYRLKHSCSRFLVVLFMPLFFTVFVAEGLLSMFGLNAEYVAFLPSERNSILINFLNLEIEDF